MLQPTTTRKCVKSVTGFAEKQNSMSLMNLQYKKENPMMNGKQNVKAEQP